MKRNRRKFSILSWKGVACLLALVMVAGLCITLTAPKAEAALEANHIVHYSCNGKWTSRLYNTPVNLDDLAQDLGIQLTGHAHLLAMAKITNVNSPTAEATNNDAPETVASWLNHTKDSNTDTWTINPNFDTMIAATPKVYGMQIAISDTADANHTELINITWHQYGGILGGEQVKPDTIEYIYDNGKFYRYEESVGKLNESPATSMAEVFLEGWTKYNYTNVKVHMADTYHPEQLEMWYRTLPDGRQLPDNYTAEVVRFRGGNGIDDFTDEMINVTCIVGNVDGNGNKAGEPLCVEDGITIDNNSKPGEHLTAVKVTNAVKNGESESGLFILRGGTLTDRNVDLSDPSTYRGTGVLVTSITKNPGDEMDEIHGGAFEIDSGGTVSGFMYGADQKYGVTRMKNVYHRTSNIFSMEKNTYSVRLYRHNYIGKWDYFNQLPQLKVYLENVDEWRSGDIILGSGRYWTGANNEHLHWSYVEEKDNADAGANYGIQFYNPDELTENMAIRYFAGDYPSSQPGGIDGYPGYPVPGNVVDPYPVLRFEKYSVYNVQKQTWYFTLGEAVADSEENNELVFYDSTSEAGTVAIPHNLTIRSSYEGELSYSKVSGKLEVDGRAGNDCSATWNVMDKEGGIQIKNGANVTFTSTADGEECGALTLDANGKGRVIFNQGIMNLDGKVTLTGGDATQDPSLKPGNGGGIYNLGTLNMTGGIITGNKANNGKGIYQDAFFNISGTPTFGAKDDIYLPANQTSNSQTGTITRVITQVAPITKSDFKVEVRLGLSTENQYNDRNVVVGTAEGPVSSADLAKFPVMNLVSGFEYVYDNEAALDDENNVLEIRKVSKVTVKKVVEGMEADTNDTFTFEATLKYNNKDLAFPNVPAGATQNGNKLAFTLKGGQSIELTALPADAVLTVTETNSGDYTPDQATQTVTVPNTDDEVVTFTNVRNTGAVKVTKTVPVAVPGWTNFEFTAKLYDSNGDQIDFPAQTDSTITVNGKQATFTLNAGETKTFVNIPKRYKLVVTETVKKDAYGTELYDTEYKVNNGSATVGNTAEVVTKNNAGAANVDNIEFINTAKTFDIEITKRYAEGSYILDPNRDFNFVVEILNGDFPAGAELKVKNQNVTPTVKDNGNIQDGWYFTMKAGQTAVVSGLPVNAEIWIQELEEDFSAVASGAAGVNGDHYYSYLTGDVELTFTNTLKSGKVAVTKSVDGLYTDEVFEFTAKLKYNGNYIDFPSNVAIEENERNFVKVDDETCTFKLTKNQTATFVNLPVGATLEVVESASQNYTSAMTPVTGEQAVTDGTSSINVTNTRKTGSAEVTKTVTGDDTSGSFNFTATLMNGSSEIPFPVGATLKINDAATTTANDSTWSFQLSNGDKALFENLPYGATLKVEETGVSADDYKTTVGSTETTTGNAQIGETKITLNFTNELLKQYTTVNVKKEVSGNMGDWNKEFTFTITYTDKTGEKTATYKLKHGDTAPLTDVLVGSDVTVIETGAEGYVMTAKLNNQNVDVLSGNKVTFNVAQKTEYNLVVNNDDTDTLETGIVLDSLPYILILAVVVVGGVLLFLRKRRNTED